jgi:glycosyltransferase involved in cell wall biosynthesis
MFGFRKGYDVQTRHSQVAGICMLRNSVDMIPFLCGHYFRIGFDALLFIDDGSSDGSYERLLGLERSTGRIRVKRIFSQVFRQQETINAGIADLSGSGFSIIVPFDADEFWAMAPGEVARIRSNPAERKIFGTWTNFIQKRSCQRSRALAPLLTAYSFEKGRPISPEQVMNYAAPWIGLSERKVAVVSRHEVSVLKGAHDTIKGPQEIDAKEFEIFHLPLRAKSKLIERAEWELRRAPARKTPEESWQSAFHHSSKVQGRIDEVWAANSVDNRGFMNVYGRPIGAKPDFRLRRLLLRALAHYLRLRLHFPRMPSGI